MYLTPYLSWMAKSCRCASATVSAVAPCISWRSMKIGMAVFPSLLSVIDKASPAPAICFKIMRALLVGQRHARSAHLGGNVAEFRKPVFHGQYRLGIIDMDDRNKFHVRNRCRIYIHQMEPGWLFMR